jgi:hypothetical protein
MADSIEIPWPSGRIDRLTSVNAGQTVTVLEGKGIIQSRPYQPAKSYGRKTIGTHGFSAESLQSNVSIWILRKKTSKASLLTGVSRQNVVPSQNE